MKVLKISALLVTALIPSVPALALPACTFTNVVPPTGTTLGAKRVSSLGQVVGQIHQSGVTSKGFFWEAGTTLTLAMPSAAGPSDYAAAEGISDNGTYAVGYYAGSSPMHALYWTHTGTSTSTVVDIHPAGWSYSQAVAASTTGLILIAGYGSGTSKGAIYDVATGVTTPLPSGVVPASRNKFTASGWFIGFSGNGMGTSGYLYHYPSGTTYTIDGSLNGNTLRIYDFSEPAATVVGSNESTAGGMAVWGYLWKPKFAPSVSGKVTRVYGQPGHSSCIVSAVTDGGRYAGYSWDWGVTNGAWVDLLCDGRYSINAFRPVGDTRNFHFTADMSPTNDYVLSGAPNASGTSIEFSVLDF